MGNIFDSVEQLFGLGSKPLVSPLPQNEELTNPALLNWYANDSARAAEAHRVNQERAMNNYITPTPVSVKPLVKSSTADFLNKILLPITRKYGIPDAVSAGQFAGEGRLGGFGAKRNNFYNIAAYDSNPDAAIHYATPEAGVEAYAKLIATNPHYAQAYSARSDPAKMLGLIQKAGYASRPDYSSFIQSTPEWKQYAQ